jgi:hypothetical protein
LNEHSQLFRSPTPPSEERCEARAQSLLRGREATNDTGIRVDPRTPPTERFRRWVQEGNELARHSGLPQSSRLICELLVDAVTMSSEERRAPRGRRSTNP